MSRIAKKPILLPKGVEYKLTGKLLEVKGPKGALTHLIHDLVQIEESEQEGLGKSLHIKTAEAKNDALALAGTTNALVTNMVKGVSDGFEKALQLVGVGYRAQSQGKVLNLSLGFSHPVKFDLPEGISAETPDQTTIVIKGINKQQVGQVAAEIRSLRPPEPYKGKGVRYKGEEVKRKETKKK